MGRSKGTSLPENSLTLGLVIMVCVLALTLTGGNIRHMFETVGSQLHLIGMKDKTSDPTQDGESGDDGAGQGQGTSGRHKAVNITLGDGTVLTLSNYPDNLAESVETVGANGTTEELAKFIALTAEKLRAAGAIDEPQYQSLMDLSNQGFKIGETQAKIQQAFQESNGDEALYADKLQAAGLNATYKPVLNTDVGEKRHAIVYDLYTGGPTQIDPANFLESIAGYSTQDLQSTVNSNGSEMQNGTLKMAYLLELAKRSGALDNPQAKAIVNFATQDIVRMATGSGSALNDQDIAENIREIRGDATSICNVGNGNAASGVQCR